MKVEQLLSFKRVADERSYTRAAERVFLTQPAIYSQVRQLEVECGAKLFYVAGKEVLLTPAGRELYTFAETVLTAHEDFHSRLRELLAEKERNVRIGALSYFGTLIEATERLRAEDPGCVVHFQSEHPNEAMELIRAGKIDFGFFGQAFFAEGLTYEQCAENEIVPVAPPGHPLVGRELTFADLAEYPLVGYASGSARLAIDTFLEGRPDLHVTYAAQTDSSLAVRTMALAMGTPALVVKQAIVNDIALGGVVQLNVSDFHASYPLYMVFLDEAELGESARRYRRHLHDIWEERSRKRHHVTA